MIKMCRISLSGISIGRRKRRTRRSGRSIDKKEKKEKDRRGKREKKVRWRNKCDSAIEITEKNVRYIRNCKSSEIH